MKNHALKNASNLMIKIGKGSAPVLSATPSKIAIYKSLLTDESDAAMNFLKETQIILNPKKGPDDLLPQTPNLTDITVECQKYLQTVQTLFSRVSVFELQGKLQSLNSLLQQMEEEQQEPAEASPYACPSWIQCLIELDRAVSFFSRFREQHSESELFPTQTVLGRFVEPFFRHLPDCKVRYLTDQTTTDSGGQSPDLVMEIAGKPFLIEEDKPIEIDVPEKGFVSDTLKLFTLMIKHLKQNPQVFGLQWRGTI